jgi:hypothetical protein
MSQKQFKSYLTFSCLKFSLVFNSKYRSVTWSNWLLFNANSAIFQPNHGENKLTLNEMMMRSTLYWTNPLYGFFIVLAQWNNSPRIDMSPHSDSLSWFRANQSLLFLLNAACLVEKQQIPVFSSPCQRQGELLPSLGIRHLSSVVS